MSVSKQTVLTKALEDIQAGSGSIIATGVLMLLMGMFAMGSPLVAGLSLAMMVGILLLVGGIGQLVFAFKSGKGLFAIVFAVLTVVIGGYMISHPGAALASFTIFLALYLVFSGISEALMSFQLRPAKGWGMVTFSGLLSLLLGLMIWNQFPLSGAWAIGILVGIRLIFNGMTILMIGIAAKGMKPGSD